MHTRIDLKIPVQFFKEGEIFVAYTPALDLSTSATTFEKVQKRFHEVVEIFFEEVIQQGTIDEVLANLGWQKVKSKWNPPIPIGHDITKVSIPYRY